MDTSTADANALVAILGMVAAFGVVILIIGIVEYVIQAIGFYKMTKNRDLPHAWIAWIPVCQNYLLGELIGNKVWGIPFANWILTIGSILTSLGSTYMTNNPDSNMIYVISIFILIFAVYTFTAYYKLYKIYTDHPVAWLVLSIIIPISAPIIVFCIRNKQPKQLVA